MQDSSIPNNRNVPRAVCVDFDASLGVPRGDFCSGADGAEPVI